MNKKLLNLGIIILLIAFAILLFYKPVANQPSPTATANLNLYPNPNLTPGDVLSATKDQICVKGYTTQVRDVTVTTKKQVYAEYGVSYPQATGEYEVDHFIPLELGGSNDIKNLWLEPADPAPGFHEKDIVENYLHSEVCKGNLDLSKAQEEIKTDWYKVYTQIPNPDNFKF